MKSKHYWLVQPNEKLNRIIQLFQEEAEYCQANNIDLGYTSPLASKAKNKVLTYLETVASVLDLLDVLGKSKGPIRVLDAGCGTGNEALLFALYGAEVVAVDLKTDRLNTANTRQNWFESASKQKIPVDFKNRNVFNMDDLTGSFDIIWSKQAISHIDPAEDFLRIAFQLLKPGGYIVISDYNRLNTYVHVKFLLREGRERHGSAVDPETGQVVPYAHERQFSINELSEMLQACGFSSSYYTPIGIVPGGAGRLGQQLPIIGELDKTLVTSFPELCICYSLTAQKPPDPQTSSRQ